MYLWNYKQLALDLKNNKVTAKEKIKYLLTIMLYIPTGLLGSNWIPGIYRFIYRITNTILAKDAPDVKALKIFNDFNYATDITVTLLLIFSVLFAYDANRHGDNKRFIERFMCLSVPVTIRIGFYVLIIFLSLLIGSLVFFNYNLQHIAIISGLGVIKKIRQLSQLNSLTSIMIFISSRIHILACVLTIISAVWSSIIMRVKIKFIAHK